jgi:hypothetical protein
MLQSCMHVLSICPPARCTVSRFLTSIGLSLSLVSVDALMVAVAVTAALDRMPAAVSVADGSQHWQTADRCRARCGYDVPHHLPSHISGRPGCRRNPRCGPAACRALPHRARRARRDEAVGEWLWPTIRRESPGCGQCSMGLPLVCIDDPFMVPM